MHGFIFIEFEKFALTQITYRNWYEIIGENELEHRQYSPQEIYPDREMFSMLKTLSNHTGKSIEVLLEEFGINIIPDLMKVYRAYVNPNWKTLDLLENAEKTIHVAVRKSTAGAAPPILDVERMRHNELVIRYVSERNMVEFGIGIIKGLARYFNEEQEITIDLEKDIVNGKSLITVRQLV
jgi:hypothetical protein